MRNIRWCLVLTILILMAVAGLGIAYSAPEGGTRAVLGLAKDIGTLSVSREDIKVAQGKAPASVEVLNFELDPAQVVVYPASAGCEYLDAAGLKPAGKAGDPELALKTFVVKLDKDAQVYGVKLTKGVYQEIQQEIDLVPMPEPGGYDTAGNTARGTYVKNQAVYGQDKPFPGKFVSYTTGWDNESQYVYVRVYPVQYAPSKKKALVLTQGVIEIYYGTGYASSGSTRGAGKPNPNPPPPTAGNPPPSTNAKNIIICPAALESVANSLRDFHNTQDGPGTSEVVTTESIAAAGYDVASVDPPYAGYKNSSLPGYSNISGYDYVLAKQITVYLADPTGTLHPQLDSVTILGDASLVPPSYYYYEPQQVDRYAWVPTDYFYVSPDYTPYEFTPNFVVGRLPVEDANQAQTVINKITAPGQAPDWSWFRNAYLVVAADHTEHLYCGEMNVVEPVNQGFLSGMSIKKCFETDGTHTLADVEPAIRDGGVGILYQIDHALGFKISSLSLTSKMILGYGPATRLPIVIASGCSCGDFDINVYPVSWAGNTASIGEALLRSEAGAIAYFGGARLNQGDALFHYEAGNIVIDRQTYCILYYYGLLKSYHGGATSLGQLFLDSINDYIVTEVMDGSDSMAIDQLMQAVFFGDPLSYLPAQQPATEYTKAVAAAQAPDDYDANDIPVYTAAPVNIAVTTTASTVKWKLIDASTKAVLEPNVEDGKYRTYSQETETQYLVRTSTPAGPGVSSVDFTKENWLLYQLSSSGSPLPVHVSDIGMSLTIGRKINATATVTVVDQDNAPVAGALVSGHWSGLTSDTDTGTTSTSGTVSLDSNGVRTSLHGTFTFTVDDVVKEGAFYDQSANVETSDSITI